MKISYNWLKSYVPDVPEPNRLADLFTYHICEVESVEKKLPPLSPSGSSPQAGEQDYLFDLGILPNRAHDLLSHQGVARELAGLLKIQFKDPAQFYKTPPSKETALAINAEGARRYTARIVRNINVGASPVWVKEHLESIGQRSINNVVDATNIVMYDCGQPCHAFDLDKIQGTISVRDAKEGEMITLLDGREVALSEKDVVIADDIGPLALAGVKGGKRAEVNINTKNILIEVANFFPVRVRTTARRLGILTDSAKRFENDLSPELCDFAMTELSALLVEYGFTDFEDIVDMYPFDGFKNKKSVSFTTEVVNKKLGSNITLDAIEEILKNYGYEFEKSSDTFTVTVPSLRLDLIAQEDMVEEIGRIYGYDKVLPILPSNTFSPKENSVYTQILSVRNALISANYREVMTYGFANTGDVEVLASASDKRFLRTNLLDGIKKSYEMNKLNAPLLGLSEIKIFEIGTIFKGEKEEIHVAYVNKKESKELSLEEFLKIQTAEFLGPRTNSPDLKNSAVESSIFSMWSAYPFIARDIAVWVPESTKPEMLAEIYKEFGGGILRGEPTLFDQFTKEGRTSYAFRLIFQADNRTLTDDEISVIMGHITEKLSSLSFEIR